MKTICTGLVMLALGALVGCSGSSTGTGGHVGGPGATVSSDRSAPLLGPKEGQFELSPPTLSTKIKQGGSEPVTISIKRGKNFDEDVALSFDKVPDHVTLDPKAPTIKKGEKDVKVTVKVGDDAGLGDHDIMVTGKPTKGPEVTEKLKVTVEKK
jgi:uncharacterized membrane protein